MKSQELNSNLSLMTDLEVTLLLNRIMQPLLWLLALAQPNDEAWSWAERNSNACSFDFYPLS
jgi:hypothetical protein